MTNLYFRESGGGYPVLLLHGFPFHHAIWSEFRKKLDGRYRIITPDLPGFGKSSLLSSSLSIADVATSVLRLIDELGISNCAVIGHSLGGYVAMAIAAQRPALLSGLVLFHSTTDPDNNEKKESRNKLIEFVKKNGPEAFTGKFVAPLFKNPEHSAIQVARDIAVQADEQTVIAYLAAMRDRPDTGNVLRDFPNRTLIIGGENDTAIPAENLKRLTLLSPKVQLEMIESIGHMGMFEAAEKTSAIIERFLSDVTGSTNK
jgi:pimeloyl-ACP methyl ester carboxylesterase